MISDHEYDDLYDDLVRLEGETGVVMTNSPTNTVGYEVKSKLAKVKHSHPMLSLGKTKDATDLIKFAGDKECVLSCKIDGLTVLNSYDNGVLIKSETRGDGFEGEDITHNAKVFDNIPLTIPYTGHFEIEGEAIVDYGTFNKINENLPDGVEPYKNPRNLASGSVRQLDNKIAKERHIKFIAWKVPTECGDYPNSFLYRLLFAKKLGFEIVPFISYIGATNKEKLPEIINSLKETAKEKGFPIDGLVMTYDDIAYGESLGMTGHHPKHSKAFKFYDDVYTTKFISIDWTMGKSGVLTPTATFQPVEIDGTMVERASLHNVSIAQNLKLISGDTIEVFKANAIIPQIAHNITAEEQNRGDIAVACPDKCPVCNGKTAVVLNNDTITLECINPDCKGKLLCKLVHFCSKSGENIDGLSESTLEKFIDLGWIETLGDIYSLSMFKDQMIELDGFGRKSVEKLLDSIEKSKTITLDKFICALSIPMVGRTASKTISKYFNYDWIKFMNACEDRFDFSKLDDFGPVMCKYMDDYLDHHFYEMNTIANYFTFVKPDTSSNSISLYGKTFVITGSMNIFANRYEAKNKIESLGGKVSGSVSKNTFALVNNDVNSSSSKNKKAKELGIQIITEEELIKIINN